MTKRSFVRIPLVFTAVAATALIALPMQGSAQGHGQGFGPMVPIPGTPAIIPWIEKVQRADTPNPRA